MCTEPHLCNDQDLGSTFSAEKMRWTNEHYTHFIEILSNHFEDSNLHDLYIAKLQALKQTNSVISYVSLFEVLIYQVEYSVSVWEDMFYWGLKDVVKDASFNTLRSLTMTMMKSRN